jgi:exonuclease VII small subunit
MTLSSLGRFAAGGTLVLAALACAPALQAQALHPLPPDLLATLKAIDTSSDEMAGSVLAIKNADLTYSMFSRRRIEAAIARIDQQLPALKAQTADLRREESLRVLLSMRTAFSDAQRNIGSISDILHGASVRTPVQADELDKLLAHLDSDAAHLDTALKQFDRATEALTARTSSAPTPEQAQAPTSPATALAPASPAPAHVHASAASTPAQVQALAPSPPMQAPGSPASGRVQMLHRLPPDFLATLKDIDASSDEMATSVIAVKNADLTYSMFSRRRVEAAIARMEQQLPALKTQTADLRREESLGILLSMRTAFFAVQRDVGSVSDILHGVTVRTPVQADELDKLLARLDRAATRLDTALKQFDTAALAMIESLDKRTPDKPAP